MSEPHVEQPMPTPNDHPSIQSLVCTDLEHREQVGIQRYGTSLQPFNGRDALRDLYEELLDGACYARQAMEERDERQRHPVRYAIGVREDGVTEIQPVAADAELAADRDRLAAERVTMTAELAQARARLDGQAWVDLTAGRDRLAATLADVLRTFTEPGHPGEPCLRSGWVPTTRVDGWRQVLAEPRYESTAAELVGGPALTAEQEIRDRAQAGEALYWALYCAPRDFWLASVPGGVVDAFVRAQQVFGTGKPRRTEESPCEPEADHA